MHLVSYNIQFGKGRDGKIDLQRIVNEIQGADLIALQEVDRYWPRSGMVDQAQELMAFLPDYYCVYGAGVDLLIENSSSFENRRRQFGNMIFSRFAILSSRNHLLPKRGSLDPLSIQRSALEATIQFDRQRLRIYSTHLTHLASETRLPQIEKLLDIHRLAVHEGAQVNGVLENTDWADSPSDQIVPGDAILMGDFNFQPNSPEYHKIVGPAADYGGIISSPDGFVDAWCQTGHDRAGGPTSDVHGIPATVDYCFVSSTLRQKISSCQVADNATGSDHFPLWAEIDL